MLSKLKFKSLSKQPKMSTECFCIMKDSRIAASFGEYIIRILDQETFECEMKLEGHENRVKDVSLLKSKFLMSCSEDSSIRIWEVLESTYKCIQTYKSHEGSVYKSIQLEDGRIVSGSQDQRIKIWTGSEPYKLIKTLTGHKSWIISLIEQKQLGLVLSFDLRGTVIFWDSKTFRLKGKIKKCQCSSNNSLIELPGDKVLVGGGMGFLYVLNVKTMQLENTIDVDKNVIGYISCFAKLEDGSIIFGGGKGAFGQIELNQYITISIRTNVFEYHRIHKLALLKDNTVIL